MSTTRRCVIYARISVSQEASVSIERQIEAAEQYATARGWQVVGTFKDEGVSATHNKPEDRAGWRALLDSAEQFDAVVVWKIDRLSRRITDFWDTYKALDAKGSSLVSVMDNLDMTTPVGRVVAGVIAGFAEMEAEAIRDRVRAARRHLVKAGRVVGGTVPYGWRSVPNPDGPGYVLAQDPATIETVRSMVDRVEAGGTIYGVQQWLTSSGIPSPTGKPTWAYSSVERLLRHPVLAGMTPSNPGSSSRKRGPGLLRDEDGLPVVDESVALLPVARWRALVALLDDRDSAQTAPRTAKATTSPLLSGLVRCRECDARMTRSTTAGRHGYSCRVCHQTITNFEDIVIEEFMAAKSERVRWSVMREVHEGGSAMLPEIELRLAELGDALRETDSDEEAERVAAEMSNLRRIRREARASSPVVTMREVRGTQHFGEDWEAAQTVDEQRAILDDAMTTIWVSRGPVGRRTRESVLARLQIDWIEPEHIGEPDVPDDETAARWDAETDTELHTPHPAVPRPRSAARPRPAGN